jgi:hypothetical protein
MPNIPVINAQDGSTINNNFLSASQLLSYLSLIPRNSFTNKSVLLNLNICNGFTNFVEPKLISLLETEIIKPLIISKTQEVIRFSGLATPIIESNIFNHTCDTPSMITFWNNKLGYTSVNADIFNVDVDTIFAKD